MNNLLTDKTKEAFEKWIHLKEQYFDYAVENDDATGIPTHEGRYFHYVGFEHFPISMQYGVIVDFFDSVDIWITIDVNSGYFDVDINAETVVSLFPSRQEARTEAVKKANQIFNER